MVSARGLRFHLLRSRPVADSVPLVCINGGLIYDHGSMWPTMRRLAKHRQVIVYDQRGRGKSEPPPALRAARIEHDAGDLAAIREALGIPVWDVLGHSWGSAIAMLGTLGDPAGVRRLVLVDPVGPRSDWLPKLHATALERLDGADREELAALDPALLSTPDPAVHARYARAFSPAWFADQAQAERYRPALVESATGAAVASKLRREGYDWTDRLRALDRPTLVLHGDRDPIPVAVAESLVALLPNARLEVIPNAGHMPFWEQPRHFFSSVERFLSTGE